MRRCLLLLLVAWPSLVLAQPGGSPILPPETDALPGSETRDPDFPSNAGRIPMNPDERGEAQSPPPEFMPGLTPLPTPGQRDEAQAFHEPGVIAAPPPPAEAPFYARFLPTGVAFRVLDPGLTGDRPGPTDMIDVAYEARDADGNLLFTGQYAGMPIDFPLARSAPGIEEALQQLGAGGSARVWIPEELARDLAPGDTHGSMVVDVERR
jgi:hypothetical protein